ncbi:Ent-kaurene oxidase [Mycena sanguinolenta]|uniref:Ent-kaurene oxidase n=1 Tax=Mycena sanguinolenta TaxID=230812 RepID=A0A8H7CIW7_9AGAR|nr:Ent-kaurene oxidase [Mycena sanguinolenta]
MQVETLVAVPVVLVAFVFYLTHNRTGLPRVGKSGPLGFILTALKSITSFADLLDEGLNKYGGKAFVVPTMAGSLVIAGPENVGLFKSSDDTAINQPISIDETLQLMHTMNARQQALPFQAVVVRSDLTRAISTFIPEVLEEMRLAMAEAFALPLGEKSTTLPLFHTMTLLVARISNRAMLGTSICRQEQYLHDVIHFAETLSLYAQLLTWFPRILRGPLYFMLSSAFGGPKEPARVIIPHLKMLLAEREQGLESAKTITDSLINWAPPEEIANPKLLAMRVLNLNFGSIHTSSIFGTHALFHLATLSESELDAIRHEIIEALESEGGYNKASLAKMRILDSTLREVGRFYALSLVGLRRVIIKPVSLVDGTVVPSGYNIAVPFKSIHFDENVYPEPYKFDCFRFSKLRASEHTDLKYGFTTVQKEFVPFGLGKHACPGRFLRVFFSLGFTTWLTQNHASASMELKLMISHLLLNYDLSLPGGAKEAPKPKFFNSTVLPDTKARVILKPRVGQAGQDL